MLAIIFPLHNIYNYGQLVMVPLQIGNAYQSGAQKQTVTFHTCKHTHTHTHTHAHTHARMHNVYTHIHVQQLYMTLIGVYKMHGRVHPNVTDLFAHDPSSFIIRLPYEFLSCSW